MPPPPKGGATYSGVRVRTPHLACLHKSWFTLLDGRFRFDLLRELVQVGGVCGAKIMTTITNCSM